MGPTEHLGYAAGAMVRVAVLSALIVLFALPLSASGQELTVQTAVEGPLLRSGLAAVERLSSRSNEPVMALRAQQTALNNRTAIILVVIAVAAVVALVLIPYTESHAHGPITIVSH
jgi:hypothetical protein